MSRQKPLQYNADIHDQQIYEWAKLGLSQNQIASRFDMTLKSLQRMMEEFPSFRFSWEKGRNENLIPLISELYRISLPHTLRKIIKNKDGKIVQIIEQEVDGSEKALMNYLRAKDMAGNWKDSINISPTGSNITITLDKQDEKL